MTVAFIGLGSNVGDRVAFCRTAIDALGATEGIEVQEASSMYETSPIGGPPQRSYINLVVKIETTLEPRGLLDVCKSVEEQIGREQSEIRWGPRVVDLDILLYGDERVAEPALEIPHPRLTERRFALVPLLEIAPGASAPDGTPYKDHLEAAEGEVELLESP